MSSTELLDCGHPESPHSNITHGYGLDADGKRYCYDCCQRRDVDYMTAHGHIFAYLSSDGRHVTGWPGYELATVTREWETSAGGFARHTRITRVRARAADGSFWYGRGPGRGMYLRLRRSTVPAPKRYNVFWSPEGRCIATVTATSPRAAIRKAPKPYRRYLGELYATEVLNR